MNVIVTAAEFKKSLEEMADIFRKKIELEVEAFDADDDARKARVEQVKDPVHGYRFFCETYFPHYLTKGPSALHLELFERLPKMIADPRGINLNLIAPRGAAKSTHIDLMFPLWCTVNGYKHYIGLIMDAFEQAAVMIEALKAEMEVNPRLAYDFPDIMGQGRTWREGLIITRNNIKIEGFGTGKKIRGRRHGPYRPDLILMDDIENDEAVKSPEQRKKLENWISKAVMELGPTDGTMDVLFAGTILHFDAVIVRFSKKPGWQTIHFQAIMNWPDRMDLWDRWEEIYINEGEPAADRYYAENKTAMDAGAILNWPDNHTLLFLMKKRAGEHAAFASEYQNKPINENNGFQNLTFWVRRKRNLIHFGAIDPSLGKKSKGRDPSAILIAGVDPITKELDILEARIRKRLPDIIISDTIALQREYQCVLWFVEAVQFQEFLRTTLMATAASQGVALPAIPVIPFADKHLRIERLQPPTASGLIRFHKGQSTLIDQLQQFPDADHDDGPDCLEMLWENALKYSRGGAADIGGIQSAPSNLGGGLSDYRLGG